MLSRTFCGRALAALLVLLTLGAWVAQPAGATDGDSSWILRCVRSDGALATNPDQQLVWPYLANYAVMGLARSAATNPSAAAAGWRWAEWYQAHQDGNGFITDYQVKNGVLTSTGTMDSTDAYAGTFLLAVSDMLDATRDITRAQRVKTGVTKAVRAIELTQDADGLTWAKPSWKVKYLMDNAEAYGGLVAAAHYASVVGDTTLAARASKDAQRMKTAVAALWNPATGAYDWAVHENGEHHTANWSLLYPDAMQQAWAVTYGLDGGAHATEIVNKMQSAEPLWSSPTASAQFDSGPATVGYWPVAAWSVRAIGRNASSASSQIRSAAQSANYGWPFNSAIAGQLAVLDGPALTKISTKSPTVKAAGAASTSEVTPPAPPVHAMVPEVTAPPAVFVPSSPPAAPAVAAPPSMPAPYDPSPARGTRPLGRSHPEAPLSSRVPSPQAIEVGVAAAGVLFVLSRWVRTHVAASRKLGRLARHPSLSG